MIVTELWTNFKLRSNVEDFKTYIKFNVPHRFLILEGDTNET